MLLRQFVPIGHDKNALGVTFAVGSTLLPEYDLQGQFMLLMHTPDDIPELGEGPELATIEQRLGAFLIDTILNGGVVVVAFAFSAWCSNGELWFNDSGGLFGFIPTLAILLFIWTVYVVSKVASTGQTVGKNQVGIKIVSIESTIDSEEAELGFAKAFAREVIGKNVLGPLTLGMGLLAHIFNERRQGLQDAVAGTIVVKSDEYEKWTYWMGHGTRLLEKEQKSQKERLELELNRIERDKRWRATQEREYQRLIEDSRARREEVNRLFGKLETEDQRNERIQRQEYADREERQKRERERIENERNQRAYQESEVERIIQENRASLQRTNALRRKLGLRESNDERRKRIRTEEHAERAMRERLERAMGLTELDPRRQRERARQKQREARERLARKAHEWRERERVRRECYE